MLVTGSTALKHFHIQLPRKKGSDLDLIGTQQEYDDLLEATRIQGEIATEASRRGHIIHRRGLLPIEFELAKPGSSAAQLIDFIEATPEMASPADANGRRHVAPAIVYALKMSHRYLRNSPHFNKTMDDILALRAIGITIPAGLAEWMKLRQKETYYYSHPSLDRSKENFFKDDNIPYLYDHDTLHEAVKSFDRPAFEFIKKDTAEVYCSKEKFNEASDDIKLATVLEESYVLALERHQIPNRFRPEPKKSFEIALMKVCTSISSGWWRAYAYDNYHRVKALYNDDYVARFKAALDAGLILPYRTEAA